MCVFFFFNDTATTEIYTLSLHDALPISHAVEVMDAMLLSDCVQTRVQAYFIFLLAPLGP